MALLLLWRHYYNFVFFVNSVFYLPSPSSSPLWSLSNVSCLNHHLFTSRPEFVAIAPKCAFVADALNPGRLEQLTESFCDSLNSRGSPCRHGEVDETAGFPPYERDAWPVILCLILCSNISLAHYLLIPAWHPVLHSTVTCWKAPLS